MAKNREQQSDAPEMTFEQLKQVKGAEVVQGGESLAFDTIGDFVVGVIVEHDTVEFRDVRTGEVKERGVTRVREDDTDKLLLVWHGGNLRSLLPDIPAGTHIAVGYVGDRPAKSKGDSPMKLYEVVKLPK